MPRARVAEHRVLAGTPPQELRLRIDLHGVGVYGPGDERKLIRWEWITSLDVADNGVTVHSDNGQVTLPDGAFGCASAELAAQMQRAQSIMERPEVIGELLEGAT